MPTYTAGTLKKLNKDELTKIAINIRNKIESFSNGVVEEPKVLCIKSEKLESDLDITKKSSILLSIWLFNVERKCFTNAHYTWLECF